MSKKSTLINNGEALVLHIIFPGETTSNKVEVKPFKLDGDKEKIIFSVTSNDVVLGFDTFPVCASIIQVTGKSIVCMGNMVSYVNKVIEAFKLTFPASESIPLISVESISK